MDLSLLENFKIQRREHWGPQKLEDERFSDLPLGLVNRFQRIGKCCDITQFNTKKVEEDNDWKMVEDEVKKAPKTAMGIKPKIYQMTKSQQVSKTAFSGPRANTYNKPKQK